MTKQGINQACITAHGARPHFYKDEDVVTLRKILTATPEYAEKIKESGLHISDLMYTYHPPVDVAPVPKELQVSKADSYGFYRLGLVEAFVRPHLNNVKSCHKYIIRNERAKAPGGNLNYLANPFWATYGIYDGSGKMAVVAEDNSIEGVNLEDYVKETRNLLATVNVAIGYDPRTSMPTAYFSRVYGVNKDTKISDNPYILRLLDYFRYTLGYAVYVATEWVGTVRGKDLSPYNFNDTNPRDFVTPVAEALIHARLGLNACQVKRYRDIQDQQGYLYDNKLYLHERLSAVAYATTRNSADLGRTSLFDVGKSMSYSEEILESGTRTKISYKLLYDKPEPCECCGGYFDTIHKLLGAGFEPITLCEKCVPKYATVEEFNEKTGDRCTMYVDKSRVTMVIDEGGFQNSRLDYEVDDANYTLLTEDLAIKMGIANLTNMMRKFRRVVFHKDAYVKSCLYTSDGHYRVKTQEVMTTRRTVLAHTYSTVSPHQLLWYGLCKYFILNETTVTAEEFTNSEKYGVHLDVCYEIKNRGGMLSSISNLHDVKAFCVEYGHRMKIPEITLADKVILDILPSYTTTIKVKYSETVAKTIDIVCTLEKDGEEITIRWSDTIVTNDKLNSVYTKNDIIAVLRVICNAHVLTKIKSVDAGNIRTYSGSTDARFFRNSDNIQDRVGSFTVVTKDGAETKGVAVKKTQDLTTGREGLIEAMIPAYTDWAIHPAKPRKANSKKKLTLDDQLGDLVVPGQAFVEDVDEELV
jgi:hypothetical protein